MEVQKQWPPLKPRRESPVSMPQVKQIEEDTFAEMRKDLEHGLKMIDTVDATHVSDQKFFHKIWKGSHTLRERLETLEVIEALSDGKELFRRNLGAVDSANAVSRCVYEGGIDVTAYVKTQSGEGAWRYDEKEGRLYKISRTVDEKRAKIDLHEDLVLTDVAAAELLRVYHSETATDVEKGNALYDYNIWQAFSEKTKQLPLKKKSVSLAYGIPVEQVPLSDELTPRNGIEAGSMPMREYAVSRIDLLLGFNTVPLTVLRTQSKGQDLASVQHAVKSVDSRRPARPLSIEDFETFKDHGKEHPGAKSLMRIACLHYIVKSVDAHNENLLIDPVTKQVSSIDNGLSLGLQSVEMDEKGEPRLKNGKVVRKNMDPYRSLAMEVIADHDDWKLDDEAMGELKRIHQATLMYLALRQSGEQQESMQKQEKGESDVNASTIDGKEIKYITELFRQLYGNDKIASVEAQYFFVRIGEIIRHGRPPVKELLEKKDLFILKGHIT